MGDYDFSLLLFGIFVPILPKECHSFNYIGWEYVIQSKFSFWGFCKRVLSNSFVHLKGPFIIYCIYPSLIQFFVFYKKTKKIKSFVCMFFSKLLELLNLYF